MATVYQKTGLTGGTANDLDGIASVAADDVCFVTLGNSSLYYLAVDNSALSEDSPWIIDPDEAGDLRWVLKLPEYAQHGAMQRPRFKHESDTDISIRSGGYNLYGVGWVSWDSELTYTFTMPADDWDYLYLDKSAIDTAGKTILTASEFIESTTVPVFSNAKGGYYNGDDRCIFAVYGYSDAGSNKIKPFHHYGGELVLWKGWHWISATVPGTSWTNYTGMLVPDICRRAEFRVQTGSPTSDSDLFVAASNSAATGLRILSQDSANETGGNVRFACQLGATPNVYLQLSAAGMASFVIETHGWYLPQAM